VIRHLVVVLLSVTFAMSPAGQCARAQEAASGAPAAGSEKPQTEVVWEWGAYYTSVGLHIPLTDEPVPNGGEMGEAEVYARLLADSLQPRVLLLEASVYPMPVLGAWIRSHHPDLYDDARLGSSSINLIQTLTAGFQEPWAVSAFVGNQIMFTRPGEERLATNRGYMGFLVSAGKKHIKDNVLIDDDWFEFEWKMKGERRFADDRLSWSFRLGTKVNRNPDIADLIYFGIGRSNLDFKGPLLSWLQNSKVSLLTEFTSNELKFVRQEAIFGKKVPFDACRCAVEFDFGLIYEGTAKYTGALADPTRNNFTLVLRPNIEF
jgi:hypothetical protein